jgi:predicted TIM-barrel fold metal-dependent hydrolase
MIDFHIHPVQVAELMDLDPGLEHAVRDVFGLYVKPQPVATLLGQMEEAGIDQAVILPLDCSAEHQRTVISNEQVSWLCERHEQLIGFASVDPRDPSAPERLERAVRQQGLRGLKLDPALQRFDLASREHAFPVYECAAELQVPVLIHCGMSFAPKGRASAAHPLALEDVAAEFPGLRIVIAHFGWPWVMEAVMLALKFPNVSLDTSVLYSGTPADSIRHVMSDLIGLDVIDRSLSSQIVFGSNYPRVDPKRMVDGIRRLELPAALERRIFHDNAARLLAGPGDAR